MNDVQLRRVLTCVNSHLGGGYTTGVYAADRLPKRLKKPAAFIANTDTHDEPGTHWVAFFIPVKGKPEYFDSYGLNCFIEGHLNFQANTKKTWVWNKKELQSLNSKVCGHYCLVYLICRMKKHSITDFLSLFTSNTKNNDKHVRTCIRKYFKDDCNIQCNRFGQVCCPRNQVL